MNAWTSLEMLKYHIRNGEATFKTRFLLVSGDLLPHDRASDVQMEAMVVHVLGSKESRDWCAYVSIQPKYNNAVVLSTSAASCEQCW